MLEGDLHSEALSKNLETKRSGVMDALHRIAQREFIMSKNGGKWAKCRHDVSEKNF